MKRLPHTAAEDLLESSCAATNAPCSQGIAIAPLCFWR
jgi:hypothetical protein